MTFYIIIALLNGVCIALSRILNGQLCITRHAFSASFINHLCGFVFLTVMLLAFFLPLSELPSEPGLYAGGMIGAIYVAVNSYIMVRLGATNAMIMVISGQMLFGIVAEYLMNGLQSSHLQLPGVALIIFGIWLKGVLMKKGSS